MFVYQKWLCYLYIWLLIWLDAESYVKTIYSQNFEGIALLSYSVWCYWKVWCCSDSPSFLWDILLVLSQPFRIFSISDVIKFHSASLSVSEVPFIMHFCEFIQSRHSRPLLLEILYCFFVLAALFSLSLPYSLSLESLISIVNILKLFSNFNFSYFSCLVYLV